MKYGAGSLTVIYQDTPILIRGTDVHWKPMCTSQRTSRVIQ
jgi:hypothetical protein